MTQDIRKLLSAIGAKRRYSSDGLTGRGYYWYINDRRWGECNGNALVAIADYINATKHHIS